MKQKKTDARATASKFSTTVSVHINTHRTPQQIKAKCVYTLIRCSGWWTVPAHLTRSRDQLIYRRWAKRGIWGFGVVVKNCQQQPKRRNSTVVHTTHSVMLLAAMFKTYRRTQKKGCKLNPSSASAVQDEAPPHRKNMTPIACVCVVGRRKEEACTTTGSRGWRLKP